MLVHLEEQLLVLHPDDGRSQKGPVLAKPDSRQAGAGGGEARLATRLDFFYFFTCKSQNTNVLDY
jgi:hypothetical protein